MSVRSAVEKAHRTAWVVLFALVVAEFFVDLPGPGWVTTLLPAVLAFFLLMAVLALQAGAGAPRGQPRDPVEVAPPVTGRWTALNSPADKVPSHGVHLYGQTYAIDIVAEPEAADGEPPPGHRSAGCGRSSAATAPSRPSAPRCSRWPTPRWPG